MNYDGHNYHVVFHHDEPINPFWVYEDHGNSHKLVVKYADFTSVMYYLYDRIK